jgi:hypothetical protein
MKTTAINRTIATLAIALGLPLGIFGLQALFNATPKSTAQGENVIESHDAGKFEITLNSGDSTSILRALKLLPAEGGRLILGAGLFPVHEPIILDKDNVELRGSGAGTILRLTDRAACPVVVIGSSVTPIPRTTKGVVVRNLVIDGNRRSQDPECWGGVCDSGGLTFIRNNALTIRGASDIKVDQIVARNARSGGVVLEKNCREIYIDNLEASENFFDGLACYETEDSYFNRIHLHHNQSAGVSLDLNFNNNVVKSAEIHHNGSQGIFMRQSHHNDFKKLQLHHNGNQGVFIAQADADLATNCTNNVFSDLTVENNKGYGFRINDHSCTENLVRNSTFKSNESGNVSEVTEKLIALLNVSVL